MRKYLAANDEARTMLLPAVPALYVWLFDFKSLLSLDEKDIAESIKRYLQHEGRADSVVKNFLKLNFKSIRPSMKPDRLAEVCSVLARGDDFAEEFAAVLADCQRPLYVGISRNLRRRTEDHLQAGDHLHDNLDFIAISDCALRWVDASAIPDPGASDADSDDRYDEGLPLAPLAWYESMLIRATAATLNKSMDS